MKTFEEVENYEFVDEEEVRCTAGYLEDLLNPSVEHGVLQMLWGSGQIPDGTAQYLVSDGRHKTFKFFVFNRSSIEKERKKELDIIAAGNGIIKIIERRIINGCDLLVTKFEILKEACEEELKDDGVEELVQLERRFYTNYIKSQGLVNARNQFVRDHPEFDCLTPPLSPEEPARKRTRMTANSGSFECDDCGAKLKTRASLKGHKTRMHRNLFID